MSDRIVMDDIVAGLKGIVYADSRFIYRVVGRKDKSYVLLTFDKENLEVSYLERPLHVFEGDRRATEEEKMTLCKALMRAGQGESLKEEERGDGSSFPRPGPSYSRNHTRRMHRVGPPRRNRR